MDVLLANHTVYAPKPIRVRSPRFSYSTRRSAEERGRLEATGLYSRSSSRPGAEDHGPQENSVRVDVIDFGPPSRLHFLAAVRTQPGNDCSQCSY